MTEDFGFFGDETFTDPYDSIPFGDGQRFEDEQVAADHEDLGYPDADDPNAYDDFETDPNGPVEQEP